MSMQSGTKTDRSIVYLFHHRLPDPRAAAIFAVEEVKSLSVHVPVMLVVPQRSTTDIDEARATYQFSDQVTLVALPVIELDHTPFLKRFAFYFSLISYSLQIARYLRRSPSTWVLTTDHLPALIASWCGKKVLIEVHDFPTARNPIWRLLLARADLILSTNKWKASEIQRRFRMSPERIFVERNGVDLERFREQDKIEARHALALPITATIVLYTGNLYSWKGVDTLIAAAHHLPSVLVYIVGGTPLDQERLRISASSTTHFIPRTTQAMMPLWQAAADVLVLPNTAREQISVRYTSPMKLFEYMASKRPIVASDLPSIREILPTNAGFFFHPDDPRALAKTIQNVLDTPRIASQRAELAQSAVGKYAWTLRATRILERLPL